MAKSFKDLPAGRPLIIGHRGSPKEAQENTLESFDRAFAAGVDGVELDVQRTADGEPVVFHDEHLPGGKLLAELTLAEAREVAEKKGIALHGLEEVLRALSGRGFINLELKQAGLEEQAAALARRLLPAESYVFSSFVFEAVAACRRIAPEVPALLIVMDAGDPEQQLIRLREADVSGLAIYYSRITAELAAFFREHNLPLFSFTVNSVREARRLHRLGIIGLITDNPAKMVKEFINVD